MRNFKWDVKETITILKEGTSHDWAKAVVKVSWGENADTIDIRNINMGSNLPGKGISLTDEEVNKMVNALLDVGYGDTEILNSVIKKRADILTLSSDKDTIVKVEVE